MLVYALFDPDTQNLRYIGKTRDTLARRLSKHCGEFIRKQRYYVSYVPF